ncbi:MAG TPA: SnoaL-like domain-containing protein [Clostridiales bacterium]|nr:SnoaL-like domain-containing protein [Clostridiales bacterium]
MMEDELALVDFTEGELIELEQQIDKLLAAWEIQNLRGTLYRFHDDQHIGDQRRELYADQHPGLDYETLLKSRMVELVESLEGNTLIHPVMTPVIEIDKECKKARAVFSSFGYEGLSIHREAPMAIWSIGYIPGVHVRQDGEWRVLSGVWQRTVKTQMEKGWVRDMQKSNCKPPLTDEQDRNYLGKYAYHKDTARKYVPVPPDKNTWNKYPDEMDEKWKEKI